MKKYRYKAYNCNNFTWDVKEFTISALSKEDAYIKAIKRHFDEDFCVYPYICVLKSSFRRVWEG